MKGFKFFISSLIIISFTLTTITVEAQKGREVGTQKEDIAEVKDTVVDARFVLASLQTPALDMLSPSSRLDMIDYYDAGMRRPIINSFDGISTLDSLTNDYAFITPSTVSSFAIKILPYKKNESVVMTLYTVGADGQAPDTDIRFYDINLKELPRDRFFREPDIKNYLNLTGVDKKEKKSIENTITFPTFEFSISPNDDNQLSSRLSVGEYLPEEDYKYISPYIKESVIYIWNGKRFELK